MGAVIPFFASILLASSAPLPSPDRELSLWATSALSGLDSEKKTEHSPDLVIHMDVPDNLRLPDLAEGLAFNAAALDSGLVSVVLREMGKRDRVRSRLHSVNVLDREGDTLGRPFSVIVSPSGLRVLVVGVTPIPAETVLRGVHTNPPAQAVRSLAQSVFRSVRYNFLVVLYPEPLASAQAFAKEVGIADVVVYRPKAEGQKDFSYGAGEKGVRVVLVPAAAEGFLKLRIVAARAEDRRYRLKSAEND